ncbi:tricarballylate utilization 4Fe-4S protein TcuB [Thalassospira sp.]|uniref:tricarballylate utilization 4Fe-4S protein TcuB n=1 Tax=Thalassospira sp. TaxID=1912094 RepID=UPI00273271A2|nr:tricarballylate utilization 4Fe-4S protein TcuB [Thalassospira sp.]MDP2699138.1 tricarballylate utilization 4Fe-4S protein TcuB [Thalassospira sp.]
MQSTEIVKTAQRQAVLDDARRAMEICNACRYCEGYCAVFPAMEQRRAFSDSDLNYLANLCHNCRGCYYSCQYAPPHEFNLNIPKTFQKLRAESYEQYAWPGPLARLFHRNGLIVCMATALGVAGVLLLTMLLQTSDILFAAHSGPGAFYAVIPYELMVGLASLTFGYAIVALTGGAIKYWRDAGPGTEGSVSWSTLWQAFQDAATLKHLGGGTGEGCAYPDEAFSNIRRVFHHFMFYGFMLCFAATSVATIYDHVFGWVAPYGWFSIPVILGTVGGMGLLIGPAGLVWLKFKADDASAEKNLMGMDVAFLALLFLVSLTGLILLVIRETPAMGIALAIHLGFVLTLFLVLPYSKFVHGIYRSAALVRYAIEMKNAKPSGE